MAKLPVTLSLALIARNEARCLARCLKSIRATVNEIVVVDTGSTDATLKIAQEFGARTCRFDWVDDFSAARNFALDRTQGEWILVLDADEYASDELAVEIPEFIQTRSAIGRLKIVSDFRRNGQVFHSQSFVSRLFPRGARFEGRIHEQLVSDLPRVDLRGELWHDGYLQSGKSDRNVKLLLHELRASPANAYLLFQLAIEYTALGQPVEACPYLERAFAALRFDEPYAPNVIVDYLYTLTELRRYETGLAVIEKAAAAVADFPDYHLACGLFYMNLVRSNTAKYVGYLPRIESSFKQCLSLGETTKYKSVKGSGSFLAFYNLGTLYHVFGNQAGAKECFAHAARLGYEPAARTLQELQPG